MEDQNRDEFATPLYENGRFANPRSFTGWTGIPPWWKELMWLFGPGQQYIPSKEVLDRELPVHKPDFRAHLDEENSSKRVVMTWLGHATCLVTLNGMRFITDPAWCYRASPIPLMGARRYRPPPCRIDELPQLDFGCISHNHYDHLDKAAVCKLDKHSPQMQWIVPKGLRQWMVSTLGQESATRVHELSWGEHVTFENAKSQKCQVWSTPAQHWSQRTLCDQNKSLWSGWAVIGGKHRFYYSGDTGFIGEEFRKIGRRLGPFDLCAIPIGCYLPSKLKPQHIDVWEAIQIHQLVRSSTSIGVHWGTYDMGSAEPYLEPREKLMEQMRDIGMPMDTFITIAHGETWSSALRDDEDDDGGADDQATQ